MTLDRWALLWFNQVMRHFLLIAVAVVVVGSGMYVALKSGPTACSPFDGHWTLNPSLTPSSTPARELDIRSGNIKQSSSTTSSVGQCNRSDDGYVLIPPGDTGNPLIIYDAAPNAIGTNDQYGHTLKYVRG